MNKISYAEQFNKAMQYFISTLPEEKALVVSDIYEEWRVGVKYTTSEWVTYGINPVGDKQLYQILQDHTSAEEWTPNVATSLYKAVGVTPSGVAVWVQPLGATDAYDEGDIVSHNDKEWISYINANVYEPGVYGWTEYINPDVAPGTEVPVVDEIPDFVQPTGAHDAYSVGNKVRYEGKVYESLIDNNIYSPLDYPDGWKEIAE